MLKSILEKKLKLKLLFLLSLIISCVWVCFTYAEKITHTQTLNPNTPSEKFAFFPWTLTQGCNAGELPFHLYTHPDTKSHQTVTNPGIATYKDFMIWAGLGFPIKSDTDLLTSEDELECTPVNSLTFSKFYENKSNNFEEKGVNYIRIKAEKGECYYQSLLAGYYFYFKNIKSGLYWAEKAAAQGETGSMNILGDAYSHGIGVVQNDSEGLKWYMIASSLGNLAAQGELLATAHLEKDSEARAVWRKAQAAAKQWMDDHRTIFINDDASRH